MSQNFRPGDTVIATIDLPGIKKGTRGVVTHVSTAHGLYTVNFGVKALPSLKATQIAHA